MHICEKCGRPFLMKDYLKNHECAAEVKEEEKELSRKELVDMAKDAGITGADRMKKGELIEALEGEK